MIEIEYDENVEEIKKPLNYEKLKTQICKKFNLMNENFEEMYKIYYKDDSNDFINVSNNYDYINALNLFENQEISKKFIIIISMDIFAKISEKSQNNIFSENIVKRCPICFLIPEIKANFLENKLEYKCPNGHKEKGKFNDLYSKLISLNDEKTKCFCQKNASFYCIKCFKFFCENHSNLEKMKEGHKTIDLNVIDSVCLEHGVTISSYCDIENKLFCIYCKNCNHIKSLNEAFIKNIENYDIKLDEISDKLKENLKKFDDLKNFLNKIILEIEKKKNEELDFINNYKIFLSNILNTYKYKSKNYCISYNNIINIHNNFNPNFGENNRIINFLDKIKEEINNKLKTDNIFLIENSYEKLKILTNGIEINCVGILNDGRLASGDEKSNFTVYNKLTFKKDIELFNNLNKLVYFTPLNDNNVIASFYNGFIRIYNINETYINIICTLEVHKETIFKVKQLSDKNFISCSRDFSFKIWNYKKNDIYINIHKEKNIIYDIIELKNNIIVYDVYPDKIKFFNYNKNIELNECIDGLNLSNNFGSRFVLINNNELLVSGNKKIYIVDLFNYKLLNVINYENQIFWVLKLDNYNYLIGDDNSDLAQLNIYDKKIISKKNTNQKLICSIANLNGKIITGGKDKTIKIWN